MTTKSEGTGREGPEQHSNKQERGLRRRLAALARAGLEVSHDRGVYRVRLADAPAAPPAEVLLPEGFPVEGKALRQLADLAAVRHPAGGAVRRACASPDFHPGDAGVAIGSVVDTEGMVIPAAVGADINCGMRLHVVDLAQRPVTVTTQAITPSDEELAANPRARSAKLRLGRRLDAPAVRLDPAELGLPPVALWGCVG